MIKLLFGMLFFFISKDFADPQMPNYSFWSSAKYRPDERLYLLVANIEAPANEDFDLITQYFQAFRFRFPVHSAIIALGHHDNWFIFKSFTQDNFLLPLPNGNLDNYLKIAHLFPIIGSNLINIASNETLIEDNFLPYYQMLAADLNLAIFSFLPFDAQETSPTAGIHYLDPVLALLKHQQDLDRLQQKSNFHVVIFQGKHQCTKTNRQQLICGSATDPLANFVKRSAPRSIDLIITRGTFNFVGKVENIPIVMLDERKPQVWPIGITMYPPHQVEIIPPVDMCRTIDPQSGVCGDKSINAIRANFLGRSIQPLEAN